MIKFQFTSKFRRPGLRFLFFKGICYNDRMIGIFDSGVGGLTVVREIFKELPQEQIIYFGDTARLPYGTKGAEFVRRYSNKITNWLLKNQAKIIVVACHTSSAWASDTLKKQFDIPIFEMFTSAAEDCLSATKNGKIGVIGTPGTIKSKSFEKKLHELNKPTQPCTVVKNYSKLKIYSRACPLFVPLAEEGWVDKRITEEIAREYLKPLKNRGVDTLVLACTHYPLLKDTIQKAMGNGINVINPAESVAREIKLFLKNNNISLRKGNEHKFVFSDEPYNFNKISELCFNKKIKIEINDPF